MKPETLEKLWRLRWAALFLGAFSLRAAFLLQWFGLPYLGALSADAWAYDRWALEILDGGLLRQTAFYQSPFYPYLLALSYKLFGHSSAPVLWLQALADAGTCLLVMRLGERAFGEKAGLWAGLLCALYRPFVFSAAVPGKETLAVFSVALFALLALRAGEGGAWRAWFLCGLAGGWAALLRTNALLLLPALLLWAWQRAAFRKLLKNAALPLLLGAALPILPATLHNFAASRDFVPVNYNGGFTFFLGNAPEATGTGIYPPGFSSNPLLEETQPAQLAEEALGRRLKPSEISSFWLRKGLAFVVENPGAWLKLTAAKFFFFWNRYEIPDNYDLQFVAANFSTVLGWPLVSFALAGCLGAAGLFLARRKEASGLLVFLFAGYLLSVLPFWVTDRYRLPALPLLLPLAGGLAAALAARDRRALRALWALPLLAVCLLPPPFNLRLAEGAGWLQLVTVYAETGDGRKALAALDKAAAADPASVAPEVILAAAVSLERRGQKAEAAALLAAASRLRR
ncbi:MAG: glycosyltransferase family 39 protein [Elusimicrobiales bacterium]|nr:glycosyltransferase family 39 protein [Elusimicrobiales bacterium]